MGQVGDDMVLWSSSETGDTGMGMFDYLPNATIDRWLKERVLLQPDTTQCAVPKGIFAAPDGRGQRGRHAADDGVRGREQLRPSAAPGRSARRPGSPNGRCGCA